MEDMTQQDQQLQETLEQAEPVNPEPEEYVGETQQPAQAKPSQQEINFRNLRQKTEQLQRERDEYYRMLQDIESRKQQASHQEESQLNPDDLVEWKHVQRELKKVKDELNQYKQYSTQVSAEARLKSQYPDFDSVVNDTTISLLREQYPEIATTINANPDLYSKAASAYTFIKKLNIAPSDATLIERARVQENLQKPRPVSSVSPQQGETPLSKANAFAQGLTPELRSQLLKEMQEAKKRL